MPLASLTRAPGRRGTIVRWRRVKAPRRSLRLAAGAVVGRPLSLAHEAHFRAGDAAGLARSAGNEVIELEVAGLAARVDVVAQGAAALRDRVRQNVTYFVHQARRTYFREQVHRESWTDPRAEQRFVGVDVAHTDHQAVVHQRELHRDAATPCRAPYVLCVERG